MWKLCTVGSGNVVAVDYLRAPFFNEHDADFGRCYGIRTSIDHHVVIFCLRTAERDSFDIVVCSGIQQHNTKRLVQGCLSNIAD